MWKSLSTFESISTSPLYNIESISFPEPLNKPCNSMGIYNFPRLRRMIFQKSSFVEHEFCYRMLPCSTTLKGLEVSSCIKFMEGSEGIVLNYFEHFGGIYFHQLLKSNRWRTDGEPVEVFCD